MKFWLFLLFTTCYIPAAYSASGYGVDVALTSPLEVNTDAGTIITATFLVTNRTENKENFLATFELPPGWETIPFEEPFFSLEPGETKLELFAFRIPPGTKAGTYPVKFTTSGQQHPSLRSESTFLVHVLGHTDISSFISQAPNHSLAGTPYTIEILVSNKGNVETSIEANVEDYLDFPVSIEPKALVV